ncbi:hypothetical protein ABIB95_005763 [Bradyrhizobium sp. LA2.1]
MADSSAVPERLASVVEAGIMRVNMVLDWEIPARDLYMEHPQRQRDEAVRTFGDGDELCGPLPRLGFDADDRF